MRGGGTAKRQRTCKKKRGQRGKGVKKNLSKALLYYTNAALLGDSQAHYEVGRCYYYGIGTRKDPDTAEIWLSSAERLGIK